jgi:hypothetical protein
LIVRYPQLWSMLLPQRRFVHRNFHRGTYTGIGDYRWLPHTRGLGL